MRQNILHLRIRPTALRSAEIIQPRNLVEEVVDNSNYDRDADRVAPNHDDSDDIGMAVLRKLGIVRHRIRRLADTASQPAKHTEQRSDDIDAENGPHELPGR